MGEKTSDFMALTAILGGAGIGLGLTSFFLFARTAPVAQVDDASVEVNVVQGRVIVRDWSVTPTIYFSRVGANVPAWEPLLLRTRVEDLREELRRETLEIGDPKALYEGVEAVRLDVGQYYLTIDLFGGEGWRDCFERRS